MTKSELTDLLTSRNPSLGILDHRGELVCGLLQSVQREDGSGRCFNLSILGKEGLKTVFIRLEAE